MARRALAAAPAPTDAGDQALRRFVGYALKRAFNVIRADLARALETFGLRMISYSVLVMVVDNPGIRQSQLAGALAIERPNLVVVIDELEGRGLIERTPDPSDRRAQALQPTRAGRRLCEEAVRTGKAHEEALLAGVQAGDRAALFRVLEAIEANGAGRKA